MTALFISILSVLSVVAFYSYDEGCSLRTVPSRGQNFLFALLLATTVILANATAVAASATASAARPQVGDPPKPPAQPSTQENTSGVGEANNGTEEDKTTDNAGDNTAAGSDQPVNQDLFIVITREGLKQLIEASGGDINSFDFEALKRVPSLMPLSEKQSEALAPVLQTAASPVLLDRLFHPANIKAFQDLFFDPVTETGQMDVVAKQGKDKIRRDQFFEQNPWIKNPGIGQIVANTEFVESNRTKEIQLQVSEIIRASILKRVSKLAEEQFNIANYDAGHLDTSSVDFASMVAETASWKEQIRPGDDPMVKTYVLVDLPRADTDALLVNVRKAVQSQHLMAVGTTTCLAWLSFAISSIFFRTFYSDSKMWKRLVVPVLGFAIIPCVAGTGLMIAAMVTGKLF